MRLVLSVFLSSLVAAPMSWAASKVKLEGYAEYREAGLLIVDGQRVLAGPKLKFKGNGEARDFDSVPLGYEVKVEGTRRSDGTVLARKLEAKPNGSAMFEGDLKSAFDQTEAAWLKRGQVYEEGAGGKVAVLGKLEDSGMRVRRVRRITDRLIPPYLSPDDFRVYVIKNDEWNAMAAPNGSVYVFSGLLRDMDDDEVAIILGHELAHATHEHSRRQYKKQMWVGLAALGGVAAAEGAIDSGTKRDLVQLGTGLAASAYTNGYGRKHEDQSDRVGLRYAYEAGYDVHRGPELWNRFAKKYGEQNKVANFFFGDHSVARDRARNLRREIRNNYSGH